MKHLTKLCLLLLCLIMTGCTEKKSVLRHRCLWRTPFCTLTPAAASKLTREPYRETSTGPISGFTETKEAMFSALKIPNTGHSGRLRNACGRCIPSNSGVDKCTQETYNKSIFFYGGNQYGTDP